jgi:hypothetical protein
MAAAIVDVVPLQPQNKMKKKLKFGGGQAHDILAEE